MLAGVDEAGRGPLAGPVVAAAVILAPDDIMNRCYRDSKKLSRSRRRVLYHHLRKSAMAYSVALASVDEIDRLNILQATMLAMRRAVEGLPLDPDRVLVDGNRCPEFGLPAESMIGGDDRVAEIAAASIIAKVVRDRYMQQLHVRFPQYGFAAHKGYGTREHLEALQRHGPCPFHRVSFAPVARVRQIIQST